MLHIKCHLVLMVLSIHSVLQGGKKQANSVKNVINFQKVRLPQEVIANNLPVYDRPLEVGYPGAPLQNCYSVLEMILRTRRREREGGMAVRDFLGRFSQYPCGGRSASFLNMHWALNLGCGPLWKVDPGHCLWEHPV